MDDHPNPPPVLSILVRSSEASRLQVQFLAQAYQRLCPQICLQLSIPSKASSGVDTKSPSGAACMAAGA